MSQRNQVVITITQVGKQMHVDVQYSPPVDVRSDGHQLMVHRLAGVALAAIGRVLQAGK